MGFPIPRCFLWIRPCSSRDIRDFFDDGHPFPQPFGKFLYRELDKDLSLGITPVRISAGKPAAVQEDHVYKYCCPVDRKVQESPGEYHVIRYLGIRVDELGCHRMASPP